MSRNLRMGVLHTLFDDYGEGASGALPLPLSLSGRSLPLPLPSPGHLESQSAFRFDVPMSNHQAPLQAGGGIGSLLDTICGPATGAAAGLQLPAVSAGASVESAVRKGGGGAARKARRARRRPAGWKPMPREQRVYKACTRCGEKNHVRRLHCERCMLSKADMKKGGGGGGGSSGSGGQGSGV